MGIHKDLLRIALWVLLMTAIFSGLSGGKSMFFAEDGDEQEDSSGHWEGVAMAQLEIVHLKNL